MSKEELKNLLEQNKTEELLKVLEQLAATRGDKTYTNDLAILSARYADNNNKAQLGLKTTHEAEVEVNKIRLALAGMIDRLFLSPQELAQNRWRKWRLPLGIACLSILLVFIGLLPAPYTDFSATLQTEDLRFRLASTGQNHTLSFDARRCELSNLQEIIGNNWQQKMEDENAQPLEIALDSDRVELELTLKPGHAFSLRNRQRDITMTLSETAQYGRIQAYGSRINLFPSEETRRGGDPELIEWRSNPGAELNFALNADSAFQLPALPIAAIEFIRRNMDTDKPQSALHSAELRIGAQAPIMLAHGEYLEMDSIIHAAISLKVRGDVFDVSIKGRAGNVRSGYEGHLVTQKTSIIEQLYANQKLAVVVGALLSLISLFWSISKALRGNA